MDAAPHTGDRVLAASRDLPYPPSRRFTFDVGRIGRTKHRVHALLEVDVTDARARIRARRRAGDAWSFTAWAIKSIADAVAAHPEVAGFNRPARNSVTVFSDVDVALVVEREVGGGRVPLPLMVGSPRRAKAAMGNVMMTTVGMAGRASGWIVPSSVHPLCIALGSLSQKPAVVDGVIMPRTILHVTVLIDHDVVDGMPAARFVADAVRRLEGAVGT